MRKLFTIGFLAVLGLAGSVQAALQDGTYEVSAKGNNGPVVFSVEIQGQAIKSIKVVRGEETPGLGVEAIAMISKEIIARQTTAVDAVSGATNSSRAVTAAVEAALQKAGGTVADLKKTHQTDAALPTNNSTDVLVVGAGGAGMGAAIAAKEAGAKVLLIEKLPLVGGTTLLASTAFNAGGSKVQMSSAKPYTAADYFAKLEKGARGQELANVKQLADLSGPTADWLIGMGADLSRVINGSQHTPKDGGALGTNLVPVMKARVDALGIETRTDTKATDLIVGTDGRVSGVRVTTPKGSYEIHAKAVILATGGFASNPDLVKRFSPQLAGYPSTASVGATGDGIIMAEKAGAALSQMDLTGPQTVAYDTGHGAVSLTNVRYNGAILVNQEGKRFANELGQTAALASAITKQTGGAAYLIFDQKAVDHASLMQTYKARGYFVEAPNLTDLAAKLGINPQALGATVAEWHTVYDTKQDPVFGRKDSIFTRIDTAPYYGQKISPASQTTYGGVMRDAKSRAVRADGSVIPGLYVAGETASQFGSGVTIAVVLGRLAGTEAAKEVEAK
ncbi:FAD-binding protein [Sutterella wadsworthensis]|uniref:FAD-binding protein n=1 Tax=Sutterella wadsworthensis TaxID=40545 RepID=UPI00242F6B93|nr:FAD-binding protein [Sutterella wadsworthensis]